MTKSLRILTVVLCGVCLFASNACAEGELKKLQGTWVGKEVGHENEGEVSFTIDGDRVAFTGWRKGEWYKGTLEVAKQDGRSILFGTVKECPIQEYIGKTSNGIYDLENDTLTIAARAPGDPDAPKDFDDESARSFVLNRSDLR